MVCITNMNIYDTYVLHKENNMLNIAITTIVHIAMIGFVLYFIKEIFDR
jgi:ABC-type iron transport system FetAB permease component